MSCRTIRPDITSMRKKREIASPWPYPEGANAQVPADSNQERIEELVKANEVLGRSIRNLVDIDNLDGFLREVMKTCTEVGGAGAAAFFRYDQASDSAFMEVWFEEGQFVDPASIPVFTRP